MVEYIRISEDLDWDALLEELLDVDLVPDALLADAYVRSSNLFVDVLEHCRRHFTSLAAYKVDARTIRLKVIYQHQPEGFSSAAEYARTIRGAVEDLLSRHCDGGAEARGRTSRGC